MDKISKGFVGRTVRAVLFIILIIAFCTAISSAGIYLASRYGLTQSREQVPLTALYLGNEGKVELPGRGKMAEGNGWRLRNSRDSYTLTLDNAVIENTVMENTVMENAESSRPAIDITGDLTIELKEGSGSWIRSEGAGIRIHSGTLVIRGKGSLDIEAKTAGILGNRTENSQAAAKHWNVAQTEQYVERRLAALQTAPPAGRRTYIIKDVRLFLNSVDRGLRLIRDAGVDARTEREETEDEIVLTLRIPKQRRKEA